MPRTVRWRGIDVDPDTADMLTAIAREAGDDIYVQGIPGYGSYRSNAASGGTDSGGGHADLNMVGYNTEQCRRVETTARKMGACAYWRPERRPDGTRYGWQNHVHILRIDCPDLSAAARAQVADYLVGFDGLYYGPGVKMPDTGDRSYTRRRWLSLGPLLSKPVTVPSAGGVTIPKPAPKEDDDMPLTNNDALTIWRADVIPAPWRPADGNTAWQADTYLRKTYENLESARAQITALTAAVQALAASHGANGDAVVEAVRSEVSKAMQGLEVTLSTKPDGA